MSISVNDPELHVKIAATASTPPHVESVAKGLAEMTGPFSIASARLEFAKHLKRVEGEQDPEWKKELASRSSLGIIIYGPSGWHRYFVRGDGTVWFSANHGQSSVTKAVAAGFDIHR